MQHRSTSTLTFCWLQLSILRHFLAALRKIRTAENRHFMNMNDTKNFISGSLMSCGDEDSIKVFLRVRPPDASSSALPGSTKVLEVDTVNNVVTLPAKPDPKVFTFDYVADGDCTQFRLDFRFGEDFRVHFLFGVHFQILGIGTLGRNAQEAVFSTVGKSLIESCVSGYNATIFAYGQTGSGKTFTMLGPCGECDNNFKHELRGVIPRSFEHLFSLISHEQESHGGRKQFLCKCSFLEIYQEQVYDLLDPAAASVQLRESIKKGVFVDGLMEQVVTTPHEAYQALSIGWLNRRVAATSMNRESSRSHAVFIMCVESMEDKGGVKNVRQSQLNLVDLAGSERQKDTNTLGIRLKEAGKINKSLSVLGNVIMSLVDIAHGRTRHVAYRDSKLTFLLRDSLGGNAKTSIVACVHPDSRCFGETLSTLNFAKRAKMIKNKAVINEDTQGNVAHLQQEIRRLRDMIMQLQSCSVPHSLSEINSAVRTSNHTAAAGGNEHVAPADVAQWKHKFVEAMLFRQRSEQEKEVLQTLLKALEDDGKKKEKILQSLRLIIRFRENKISMLEKNDRSAADKNVADVCAKLEEDLASLQPTLDQLPQMLHMHRELHSLRAQLAEAHVRLAATTSALLDSSRLACLEQVLHELQANNRRESAAWSPAAEHGSSALRFRETIEALEQEKQKLHTVFQEERRSWEMHEASLQAELTAARRMVTELELMLQANNLKHRIERDSLADLHSRTLKVMTTPQRAACDLHRQTVTASLGKNQSDMQDTSIAFEVEDICQEAPPPGMTEGVCEALNQEIMLLQATNNSLQERISEYEADLLHMRQHVDQLELNNNSITEMLTRECARNTDECQKREETLRELRCTVEKLTSDLAYSREETLDLKILLQSSDRELREEREKNKLSAISCDQRVGVLETQLLQLQSALETANFQLDQESKDKAVAQEALESLRLEMAFFQEQSEALELALKMEKEAHKATAVQMEEVEHQLTREQAKQIQLQEQNQEFGKLQKQVAEVQSLADCLEQVSRERDSEHLLRTAASKELEKCQAVVIELRRDISDGHEAVRQQMLRSQELKRQTETLQQECTTLHDQLDSATCEAADHQLACQQLQQQLSQARDDLNNKETELNKAFVAMEMLKEDLAYYTEEFQKSLQETETVQKALEAIQKERNDLQEQADRLNDELAERDSRLEQIKHSLEMLTQAHHAGPQTAHPLQELTDKKEELSLVKDHNRQLGAVLEELENARQQRLAENQVLKKVSELEAKVADLQEKNAILAGHANHQQKVNYVQQMQREYNQLKSVHDETLRKLLHLEARLATAPMKDRTNLVHSPSSRDNGDKILQ